MKNRACLLKKEIGNYLIKHHYITLFSSPILQNVLIGSAKILEDSIEFDISHLSDEVKLKFININKNNFDIFLIFLQNNIDSSVKFENYKSKFIFKLNAELFYKNIFNLLKLYMENLKENYPTIYTDLQNTSSRCVEVIEFKLFEEINKKIEQLKKYQFSQHIFDAMINIINKIQEGIQYNQENWSPTEDTYYKLQNAQDLFKKFCEENPFLSEMSDIQLLHSMISSYKNATQNMERGAAVAFLSSSKANNTIFNTEMFVDSVYQKENLKI